MKLTIEIDVPEQLLKDILVTAVEGGSNYWAKFKEIARDESLDIVSVQIRQHESQKPTEWDLITPITLMKGLELLTKADFPNAKPCLMRCIDESYDALDADIVLQMTMFSEVVYG